jgi:hypothetical protein
MRFTDAHSSSGVCSPSRYALLTGRYHWRTRLQRGIVGTWQKPLIAPDRLTVAGLLQAEGYRTACVGKWHLGWDWAIEPGTLPLFQGKKDSDEPATNMQRQAWAETFSREVGGGPTTRGFDQYFGTDVPNWPPYCFIENNRTVGIPNVFLPSRLFANNQASVQGPALTDPSSPGKSGRAVHHRSGEGTKAVLPVSATHVAPHAACGEREMARVERAQRLRRFRFGNGRRCRTGAGRDRRRRPAREDTGRVH